MGRGVLLGLLSGLGDLLNGLFMSLFKVIIDKFIAPIVRALLSVVFTIIQYFTSAIFYEISKFLLGLIDFVEVLFRALAGLPSTAADGSEIVFSLNGKSGDLLIQMLTSQEVLQVFYATAIVGVFLLIITTIFSMIKVEYTTEGAQNSKSSIIGKSLKSLCNMLIIPLLCIMGVFIGNQVLDLIDTATGGGQGTKISGTLWVTAASGAMLEKSGSMNVALALEASDGTLIDVAISYGLVAGFDKAIDELFGREGKVDLVKLGDPSNRDAIEEGFSKGGKGFNYYKLTDVVNYYFPFEVNYLVLIFAACIIIKCLYHTCFGLVDRLYQCTALFIVMPMVVGMSPVKDSLGSWRSKFISKALSAYGTVISLNLFFIIVKIMLNIDVKFGSAYNAWIFPKSFMAGLIKCIMVLVGCLMIEKLAGDLGGYFGGGNAMADGAGLEKGVSGMVKKGVAVAGTAALMATGAGSLALSGGKAIAGKIAAKNAGKGLASDLAGAGQKANAASSAAADAMKKGGFDAGHLNEYGKFESSMKSIEDENMNILKQNRIDQKIIDDADEVLNNDNASDTAKAEALKRKEDAQNRQLINTEKITKNGEEYIKRQEGKKAYEEDHTGIADAYEKTQKANSANAEYSKAQSAMDNYNKKQQEEKETKSRVQKERLVRFGEGTKQAVKDRITKLNPFKSTVDEYNSAADKAMGQSDEGTSMNEDIKNYKKNKISEAFDARNKTIIEERKLAATNLILTTTNAKLADASIEATANLNKLNEALEKVGRNYAKELAKGKNADANTLDMYTKQAESIRSQMTSLNGKVEFDGAFKVQNTSDLKVDFKLDQNFMDKLKDQVKKGVKMDDIMAQIKDEFKRIGLEGNDKLLNEIYKSLEELKGQIGK